MENIIAHRILRRIHKSANVILPAAHMRAKDLHPGDHVMIIDMGNDDELLLRFVRTSTAKHSLLPAQEPA
jgi:antitoxin component of MazEF toxin-antitoxin module